MLRCRKFLIHAIGALCDHVNRVTYCSVDRFLLIRSSFGICGICSSKSVRYKDKGNRNCDFKTGKCIQQNDLCWTSPFAQNARHGEAYMVLKSYGVIPLAWWISRRHSWPIGCRCTRTDQIRSFCLWILAIYRWKLKHRFKAMFVL